MNGAAVETEAAAATIANTNDAHVPVPDHVQKKTVVIAHDPETETVTASVEAAAVAIEIAKSVQQADHAQGHVTGGAIVHDHVNIVGDHVLHRVGFVRLSSHLRKEMFELFFACNCQIVSAHVT